MTDNPYFVTTDWLQANLGKPNLSVVDGSWYLPAQGRDAQAEYASGHIPGAVIFDHDKVVDTNSTLPHTLPSSADFARAVGAMGISERDTIIVYDGPGLFSAPRTRWLFRVMGAENVRILEGGLDGWKREGRPLTVEPTVVVPKVFNVQFNPHRVATLGDMRLIVANGSAQIADARPTGRFNGVDPEPRPGVRGGHMPGAHSLPSSVFARDGKLLPQDELRKLIEDAGVDLNRPVVTSCGSGVTAAIISLGLETLGKNSRLYDGSWAEWGSLADTPIVKDEA